MNVQPHLTEKSKLKRISKIGSGLLVAQLETKDKTGQLVGH